MKSEVRTGVGHGDFVSLIRIKPDLATSALEHASGEPLLELQRHHRCSSWSTSRVLRVKKKRALEAIIQIGKDIYSLGFLPVVAEWQFFLCGLSLRPNRVVLNSSSPLIDFLTFLLTKKSENHFLSFFRSVSPIRRQ